MTLAKTAAVGSVRFPLATSPSGACKVPLMARYAHAGTPFALRGVWALKDSKARAGERVCPCRWPSGPPEKRSGYVPTSCSKP